MYYLQVYLVTKANRLLYFIFRRFQQPTSNQSE